MPSLAIQVTVRATKEGIGRGVGLNIQTVVDEVPNRDPLRQLRHPAKMVPVPVGRDEVIDLLQSGVRDRRHDATHIAVGARASVARVDQQRLARRRNEKRRVATFHVDQIDIRRASPVGDCADTDVTATATTTKIQANSLMTPSRSFKACRLTPFVRVTYRTGTRPVSSWKPILDDDRSFWPVSRRETACKRLGPCNVLHM